MIKYIAGTGVEMCSVLVSSSIYKDAYIVYLCLLLVMPYKDESEITMDQFLTCLNEDAAYNSDSLYDGMVQVNMCRVLLCDEHMSPFLADRVPTEPVLVQKSKLCDELVNLLKNEDIISDVDSKLYNLWKNVKMPVSVVQGVHEKAGRITWDECDLCHEGCKTVYMKWIKSESPPKNGKKFDNQNFNKLFQDRVHDQVQLDYKDLGEIDFAQMDCLSFIQNNRGDFYKPVENSETKPCSKYIVECDNDTTGFCKQHNNYRRCHGLVKRDGYRGYRCENYSFVSDDVAGERKNIYNCMSCYAAAQKKHGRSYEIPQFEPMASKKSYEVKALLEYANFWRETQTQLERFPELVQAMRKEVRNNIRENSNKGRCLSKFPKLNKDNTELKKQIDQIK